MLALADAGLTGPLPSDMQPLSALEYIMHNCRFQYPRVRIVTIPMVNTHKMAARALPEALLQFSLYDVHFQSTVWALRLLLRFVGHPYFTHNRLAVGCVLEFKIIRVSESGCDAHTLVMGFFLEVGRA